MYSTVTAKGQVTLPSSWRHKIGLRPGLKVTMHEVDGGILIEAPTDLTAIRAQAQAEMRQAGTWGAEIDAHDTWAEAAAERLADHG